MEFKEVGIGQQDILDQFKDFLLKRWKALETSPDVIEVTNKYREIHKNLEKA
jgi:hypothetical protein